MTKESGRNGLVVALRGDPIVPFNIFSDGAGGCLGESKSDAERLHHSSVAEVEACKQPECIIQQAALVRE